MSIEPAPAARLIRQTRALLIVNGALWLILALASFARLPDQSSLPTEGRPLIAALMFVNAAVLLWLGASLDRARRSTYLLSVLVVLVNLILTVTDEVGLLDLVALLVNVMLLALLLFARSAYLSAPSSERTEGS